MTDNPHPECLFVGGSADGKWLKTDPSQIEVRIPSLTQQPALQDPVARALDDDPVPDASVVYEVYRRLDATNDTGETIVYALNNLTEEAIDVQLIKHFGSAESAPLM